MNLEWNVFRHDVNKKEIVTFNIFNHWKFNEDVQKSLKKFKDKDEFAKQLRRDLMYYFWSKYEYEVVITSFPPYITMDELDNLNEERVLHKEKYGRDYVRIDVNPDVGIKIDIYTQVMNNWDVFLDYVWNSKRHRENKIVNVKRITPNFFGELAELMKRYNIKSISPFCNCEEENNHHIMIDDDGVIEAIGMKIK